MAEQRNDSWIGRWTDHCTEGYECPFESLTIHGWTSYTPSGDNQVLGIVGTRQSGERSVPIPSTRLRDIARHHLQSFHDMTESLFDANLALAGHEVAVAAVACLIDVRHEVALLE